MTIPAWTRDFADSVWDVIDEAYGIKGGYGEAVVTHIAASLDVASSTFYAFCNGSRTFPVGLIPRLADLLAKEKGIEYAIRLLNAAVGNDFEVLPTHVDDETARRLSDTPRVLKEVGETIQALGVCEADGRWTRAEAASFEKEATECIVSLREKIKECWRRARP